MLSIVTDSKDYEWHVGEQRPAVLSSTGIKFIQADGDELVYISNHFKNIPMALSKKVVRWFGETAKFIYENL